MQWASGPRLIFISQCRRGKKIAMKYLVPNFCRLVYISFLACKTCTYLAIYLFCFGVATIQLLIHNPTHTCWPSCFDHMHMPLSTQDLSNFKTYPHIIAWWWWNLLYATFEIGSSPSVVPPIHGTSPKKMIKSVQHTFKGHQVRSCEPHNIWFPENWSTLYGSHRNWLMPDGRLSCCVVVGCSGNSQPRWSPTAWQFAKDGFP